MRAIVATDYNGYVGEEFNPVGDPLTALEAAYHISDAQPDKED